MDKFTPERIGPHTVTFAVEIRKCVKCNKDMVRAPDRRYCGFDTNIFPKWIENTFDAQASRAGLVIQSNIKVDDKYICTICENAGLADFLCALCGERKPTSKKQESFGDPPEHLCSDCYNTVSAKEWDEKKDELESEHRYDFE